LRTPSDDNIVHKTHTLTHRTLASGVGGAIIAATLAHNNTYVHQPLSSKYTHTLTVGIGGAIMQHLLVGILVDVVCTLIVMRVQVAGSATHMDLATYHITDGRTITNTGVAKLLHLGACRAQRLRAAIKSEQ
jgi:hypothetical protein